MVGNFLLYQLFELGFHLHLVPFCTIYINVVEAAKSINCASFGVLQPPLPQNFLHIVHDMSGRFTLSLLLRIPSLVCLFKVEKVIQKIAGVREAIWNGIILIDKDIAASLVLPLNGMGKSTHYWFLLELGLDALCQLTVGNPLKHIYLFFFALVFRVEFLSFSRQLVAHCFAILQLLPF